MDHSVMSNADQCRLPSPGSIKFMTARPVSLLATLDDGRKFLATAGQKIHQTILGATI